MSFQNQNSNFNSVDLNKFFLENQQSINSNANNSMETNYVLNGILTQNIWLISEVKELKSLILQLQTQINKKTEQSTQDEEQQSQEIREKRKKKSFKKVVECPFEECNHKYSSKIALNCHIRIKHQEDRN